MRPDTIAFIAVAALVIVTPGLDMVLVARNGISGGMSAALRTTAGILVGVTVHAVTAIAGLSAILATSATAFHIVRVVGGVYLIYVGSRSLLSARRVESAEPTPGGLPERPFVTGFMTNLLNPKVAILFLSLLPQFVLADDVALTRTAQLAAIFLFLAVVWLLLYSWVVSKVGRSLQRPRAMRAAEALSGFVLIGLGIRVLVGDR